MTLFFEPDRRFVIHRRYADLHHRDSGWRQTSL